jgi:hypothetical protein
MRLPTLRTMPAVYMERCDQTRNVARFYQVDIQPTLFGDWTVICRWDALVHMAARGKSGVLLPSPKLKQLKPTG